MRNNNFVSSAKVYAENQYAEFTTLFRIKFKEGEVPRNLHAWKELLKAWAPVCILALEMRMDACVSMLFRNRDNIIMADYNRVVFKKSNGQIHSFNHPSFEAMEQTIKQFKAEYWGDISRNPVGVRQLLKALYWIPESERVDHGGFGFGQLISCLEEFTFPAER